MPTFIKTGFWESAVKGYKGWLNLEDLISGIAITGSGTAGQIAFWTNTSVQSGSSNLVWDATNNRLGIRSSAPTGNLEIKTANDLATLRAYPNDDFSSPLHLLRGNNGVVALNTFTSNGTITSPTDVSASGGILRLTGNIYIGGAYRNVARMEYITTSIPAIGNPPTGIRWLTTDNSYTLNERFGTTSNGNFQIGDAITNNRNSRLFVRSSGATAATWTAQFHNSSLNNALVIDDAGSVMLGTATSSGQRLQISGDALISSSAASGTFFEVKRTSTTDRYFRVLATGNIEASSVSTADPNFQFITGANNTSTSGDRRFFWLQNNFSPTSGTATYRSLEITTTINQTGGANGITRGLYINPTLTAAADFRAIETTAGKVIFGNLPTSSAGLPSGAIWNNAGVVNIVP